MSHKDRAHALLPASGAEKWLACPPSARLEEEIPDPGSSYAAEGTLAHEIAELKARKHFLEGIGPRKFSAAMKALKENELYQREMDGYTDSYLEHLKECSMGYPSMPYVAIEKRVDFSAYAPEGFGTCDCVMIHGKHMRVIDLKYGKGVPKSAENNPQLMLYALGAYEAYRLLYPIETVTLTIFQPRLDSISEWDIGIDQLLHWAKTVVKDAAQDAYEGKGAFQPGEHCRFCKAQAQCRAKADSIIAAFPIAEAPRLLSDAEIGRVLHKAKELVSWANAVEEYALSAVLAGKNIEGWKAVEGRTYRVFTDADAAFAALIAAGTPEEMLYERKPLTLAQTEKVIGKKTFEEIAGSFVVKSPGKPTLAPESDKRPALVRDITQIFEEVK